MTTKTELRAAMGKWWRKFFGLKGVDVKLYRTSDIGPRMYVASIMPLWSDDHFDGMDVAAEQACRIAIEQYEAYRQQCRLEADLEIAT